MFNNRALLITNNALIKPLQFIRLKRSKLKGKGLAPNVVKLITQLSVMSAARKQPKMIKLCKEDLIKHEIISKLWSHLKRLETEEIKLQLQKQELSIREANEELLNVNKAIYDTLDQQKNHGKRFSLELRIPSQYPPRKIWNYDDIKA